MHKSGLLFALSCDNDIYLMSSKIGKFRSVAGQQGQWPPNFISFLGVSYIELQYISKWTSIKKQRTPGTFETENKIKH